jgi:hypothetical protein
MSGGLKYDNGKAPMSMLDWRALEQVAKVLDYGARKYTQSEVCTCGAQTAEYTKSKNQCGEDAAYPVTQNGATKTTLPSEKGASAGRETGSPPIRSTEPAMPRQLENAAPNARATSSGESRTRLESTIFLSNSCLTSTDKVASTAGQTASSSSPHFDDSQILDSGVEHASTCGSGRNNWRKGMRWSRLADAALRHLFKWASGSRVDEETGLSHLAHAMCCLMFLLNYEQTGLGDDDV